MPVLGDHYGRVLEAGELKLMRDGGSFTIAYHEHVMPVAPRSLNDLLARAAERVGSDELAFLADSFGNLPALDRHRSAERDPAPPRQGGPPPAAGPALLGKPRDRPGHRPRRSRRSTPRRPSSMRCSSGRTTAWPTGGRPARSSTIAASSTSTPWSACGSRTARVFEDTHVVVLDWVRKGVLDGLRVDHPDGLRDPRQYFERLHEAAPERLDRRREDPRARRAAPRRLARRRDDRLRLPQPRHGPADRPVGRGAPDRLLRRFTGVAADYPAMVRDKKHLVLKELFGSDLARLTSLLASICERQKRYRDYTRRELSAMLREVIACFPVYRTYIEADSGRISERDRQYIDEAIEAAKREPARDRRRPLRLLPRPAPAPRHRASSSRRWSCGSSRTPAR